jgi:hypothetical protein
MKGTYFPLRSGCARCSYGQDLRNEFTLLLDPADEDDPVLLSFNILGEAVAAPHVTDPWEQERVTYSVKRYKLDFPPLSDKRKTIWEECWDRIVDYRSELKLLQADPSNAIAREGVKKAAKRIREMMKSEKELSAVARSCVTHTGNGRLLGLLQTS